MSKDRPNIGPLAQAVGWVSKITTVVVEMALPAIGGGYLDQRFGTKYWAPAGLGLGFVLGMWHLLQMTRGSSSGNRQRGGDKGEQSGGASG